MEGLDGKKIDGANRASYSRALRLTGSTPQSVITAQRCQNMSAQRDVVSRSSYLEIVAGRGSPHGGVYIDVSHLGASFVEDNFPGMVERCRDVGFDLARDPVEVSPKAHYLMGGVNIDTICRSNLDGLFVAGEDSAGVHEANRLGGNGMACSTVFGGIAGERVATYIEGKCWPGIAETQMRAAIVRSMTPFDRPRGEEVYVLRDGLKALMWDKAGLVRNASDVDVDMTTSLVGPPHDPQLRMPCEEAV
jgi:succinate dehydrogenase flavoprotein subunit